MSESSRNENARSKPAELIAVPAAEARQLLAEGAKTFGSTIIWVKDQKQVIKTHLTAFNDLSNTLRTFRPRDFDLTNFLEELARSPDSICFFSISLQRANVFFKAPYLKADERELYFKMPDFSKILKVQRRKDLRFPIPHGHVLKIEFQDPLFFEARIKKKVFDISAGGVSFCVSPSEEMIYQPGSTLKEVTLTIQGRTIIVDAEIRHTMLLQSGPKKGEVKVGALFKNIRPGDSQHIATYVFEENRKLYTRYL